MRCSAASVLIVVLLFGGGHPLFADQAAGDAPWVAGLARFADDPQAGPLLLTELSCTACHPTDVESLRPKPGPNLSSAALRLQPQWVRRFLQSPQAVKPGTTMPAMFSGHPPGATEAAIDALVAFLGAQRQPLPELESTARRPVAVEFWSKGDAARGEQLYYQIGCAACHRADPELVSAAEPQADLERAELRAELIELGLIELEEPVPSVPLPHLSEKYSLHSLTLFLLDPLAVRPGGRMPDLKLEPAEAADIAAYLLGAAAIPRLPDVPEPVASLVAAGERLFSELRCQSCHAIGSAHSDPTARPLAELRVSADPNCLVSSDSQLPDYRLSDAQRSALTTAILGAGPVSDELTFRMLQLNCYACHARDGRGGVGPERRQFLATVGHVDLGDEGRLPPSLDRVGRKLQPAWMQRVFAGDGDVRPFMTIRMPRFGALTKPLVAWFQTADRSAPPVDPLAGVPATAEAGRQLMDVGCVQCHPIGGERLAGVVGVDLAEIDQRVHADWFFEFLLDPAGLKERTRMPAFFRNRTSSAPEILGGDVDRQIASLWAYLKAASPHPLPQRIQQEREHDFELVPRQRPLVLRTFMERAGPHAIAVGFPQGVHLAFDAERVRVAQFWRGRFLDAHGTWFDRFTPPAQPLGTDVIDLTDHSVADDPAQPPAAQFAGYRLDRDGVPTFLYRLGAVAVEDRFQPGGDNGFVRFLKFASLPGRTASEPLWFEVLSGSGLRVTGTGQWQSAAGLTVELRSPVELDSRLAGDPLRACAIQIQPPVELQLEYRW